MATTLYIQDSPLIRLCQNKSQIYVISVFLEHPFESFNQSEIKEATGLSKPTIRGYIRELDDIGVIEPVSAIEFELNKQHHLAPPLYMLYHCDKLGFR